MDPPADFLIFGGDLAQLGDPSRARARRSRSSRKSRSRSTSSRASTTGISTWARSGRELFGAAAPGPSTTRACASSASTRSAARPDYWTARKMTPEERMGHMAALDGTVAGAVVRRRPRAARLAATRRLSDWDKDKPVIIFTHNPLYEYYPPWNFWVRDWREVHEIAQALHQGHQHPRPRPPGALQRDRHHALDRHAGDLLAVALRAGGRARSSPSR